MNRKLVVFVPPDALDAVRDALFAAGAGRIGEYHPEVRGAGVLCQPVLPERRVQEVGTDGWRQLDAERLRSGPAMVLVAVVLQHTMLREGHGFLSVLRGKNSNPPAPSGAQTELN